MLILLIILTILPFYGTSHADELNELLRISGPASGYQFGKIMAGAGDINGDGLSDFIVGNVPDSEHPGHRCCWVWMGSQSPEAIPDFVIHQVESTPFPEDSQDFGEVVDGGYDINDDGFDDLVISFPGWYMDTGKIYIYLGCDSLDLESDIEIEGATSTWSGTAGLSRGLRGRVVDDVNGDGFDEFVCLVYPYSSIGGAYVYFGGAPMDTIHDLSFQGVSCDTLELGSDIASGDVNGDGFNDLVVGASYVLENPVWPEAAWVFYGGPEMDDEVDVRLSPLPLSYNHDVCIPGDLNGDGYDDIAASLTWPWPRQGKDEGKRESYHLVNIYFGGPRMDGEVDLQFNGRLQAVYFSLTGGDLNLDGYPDLIVGENSRQTGSYEGRIAVYFGSAEMDTFPDIEVYRPGKFGETLAWLGDMNGDGWPEFAVGNPSGAGEIYIYTMGEVSGEGPAPDDFIVGEIRIIPNPTRGSVFIEIPNVKGNGISANLYDLNGRCIRTLGSQIQQSELNYLFWDGADAFNRPAPPGTYILVTRNDHHRATGRIVVNR